MRAFPPVRVDEPHAPARPREHWLRAHVAAIVASPIVGVEPCLGRVWVQLHP